MSNVVYRKEIDGLRAIAVLPVVIFHFNKDLLPGGYIGVDVFFVISGFLITRIILDQLSRGEFKFSQFWKRRIKRILPALIVMVYFTLVFGMFISYGPDLNNLGSQGIAALLSYSNLSHLLLSGNYWGHEAENSPLLHTWSLSVEEQFYLVFPLFLVLINKYVPKKIFVILFSLVIISFSLYYIGAKTNPTLTFYLLPTRAWELGVGAMLATTFVGIERKTWIDNNNFFSSFGLTLIVSSYFLMDGESGISRFLFIPVIGASLIIACSNCHANIVYRILSIAPIVYLGKLSYSIYLWHWPVLVYSSPFYSEVSTTIFYLSVGLIILLLSVLSYYLIEVPTRNNDSILPVILISIIAGIVFSIYLKLGSFPEDTSMYSETEWHGNLYSVNPNQGWSESAKKRLSGIKTLPSDPLNAEVYATGGIRHLYGDEHPEIVLIGDSHALMWAKVLDEIAEKYSASISFYSADGTPPFFEIPPVSPSRPLRYFTAQEKYEFDTARLKDLAKWKPKAVIMVGRWEKQSAAEVEALVKFIGDVGSKIVLIEQPPVLYFGNKNAPQYLSHLKIFPQFDSPQYIEAKITKQFGNGLELTSKLAENYDHVVNMQISDMFMKNGKALVLDGDDVLYIDEDHLSYAGSLKAKNRIEQLLKKILNSGS